MLQTSFFLCAGTAKMVFPDEERARIQRRVEDEQGSQGNVDARDKDQDQDATLSLSDVDPSASQKRKPKERNILEMRKLWCLFKVG
jgi:hypothetical protein